MKFLKKTLSLINMFIGRYPTTSLLIGLYFLQSNPYLSEMLFYILLASLFLEANTRSAYLRDLEALKNKHKEFVDYTNEALWFFNEEEARKYFLSQRRPPLTCEDLETFEEWRDGQLSYIKENLDHAQKEFKEILNGSVDVRLFK